MKDHQPKPVVSSWMNDHRLKPVVSIHSEAPGYHRLNSALPPGSAFVPELGRRAKFWKPVVSSWMNRSRDRDCPGATGNARGPCQWTE